MVGWQACWGLGEVAYRPQDMLLVVKNGVGAEGN